MGGLPEPIRVRHPSTDRTAVVSCTTLVFFFPPLNEDVHLFVCLQRRKYMCMCIKMLYMCMCMPSTALINAWKAYQNTYAWVSFDSRFHVANMYMVADSDAIHSGGRAPCVCSGA